MRCAMSRRLGLMAVFGLVTAVFGVNFLSAQGIRPPIIPPIRPPGGIGNPNLPGRPGGFGGGMNVYTCSGCGSSVSESSTICPICRARFTNVGPDGRPLDGGLPGFPNGQPGFPNGQPGFNPGMIQPPGFVPGNNAPPGFNPGQVPPGNPQTPPGGNPPPQNPQGDIQPANPPPVQVNAPPAKAENVAPANTESDSTLAITLAIVAGAVILIGGGIGLFFILRSDGEPKRRKKKRRREREIAA